MSNSRARSPYPPTSVTCGCYGNGLGSLEIRNHRKLYLCRLSRCDSLSFHEHRSPLLQANTHTSTLSVCLHRFLPESNTLHRGSHVENHSAFHSNQTRLLSNYFWSRPSWPGHCLSALAWEFIGQNSGSWEGGHFFSVCNAPSPAYMPPHRLSSRWLNAHFN